MLLHKAQNKKEAVDQRDYFEKCNESLKTKIIKNQQINEGNFKRIMKENVDLIGVLNDLKKLKQQRLDFLDVLTKTKNEAKQEIEIAERIHHLKKQI